MIGTVHYLVLGALLFGIGTAGVLIRRSALVVLMSIEIMLTGANVSLLALSRQHGDMAGHGLAFLVIAVAAAEAAIGLAIIVALFRTRRTSHVDEANLLRDES